MPEEVITVMATPVAMAAIEVATMAATGAGAGVAGDSAWASAGAGLMVTATHMVMDMDIPTATVMATAILAMDMHIPQAITTIPATTRQIPMAMARARLNRHGITTIQIIKRRPRRLQHSRIPYSPTGRVPIRLRRTMVAAPLPIAKKSGLNPTGKIQTMAGY